MTTMTTGKRHSPEQVVRKLAQADGERYVDCGTLRHTYGMRPDMRRRDAGPYPHRRANKAILAAQTVEWATLHYGEGLSIRQIAQQTGVSKSTVHRRVRALLYTHPSVRRCAACGRALCGTLPRPVVVGRIRQVGPMHFVYEERRTMSNHNPVTPRGQDLAHTAL